MSQHTINLPCIADTWLDNGNYTATHGADTALKGGWNYMPSSEIVLRFNYSTLPPRKKATAAMLKIYNLESITPGSYGYIRYNRVEIDWDENTANWLRLYNSQFKYSKVFYSLPGSQYINVDITDMVNNSDVKYGMYLDYIDSGSLAYILISSRETANPPILQITYEDVPPDKPIPQYPDSQYIDNTTAVRFDWDYLSSVGGEQQKFDLQYSSTNGATWTTITQVTANTYYEMPAGSLPSGTIMWRVKTYNEYSEASDYSDIYTFYSIGAPAAPSIYDVPTDTAKPTISWTASQQEVYQITVYHNDILMYDTGIQPNKEYSHKVTVFLPDDAYTIKLRVQNEYGLWSAWAERLVSISTVKPTKPVLTVQQVRNGIQADIINTVEAVYFLLLRDGVPVYKATASPLYDYAAEHGKEYQYTVRAVSESNTYVDSEPNPICTNILSNLFAGADNISDILELKYNLSQPPEKNYKLGAVINTMYASGREYPIVEKSNFLEESIYFIFFTEDFGDVCKLQSMVKSKQIILFRDSKSKKMYGSISAISCSEVKTGYQISFSINAVDYMEGIYD